MGRDVRGIDGGYAVEGEINSARNAFGELVNLSEWLIKLKLPKEDIQVQVDYLRKHTLVVPSSQAGNYICNSCGSGWTHAYS